jgi:hypothetical protein
VKISEPIDPANARYSTGGDREKSLMWRIVRILTAASFFLSSLHITYIILVPFRTHGGHQSPVLRVMESIDHHVYGHRVGFDGPEALVVSLAVCLIFPAMLAARQGYYSARAWQLRRRVRAGVCVMCCYDLRCNTSKTCPECGTEIGSGLIDRFERNVRSHWDEGMRACLTVSLWIVIAGFAIRLLSELHEWLL